jgi:hypothetical protein
MIVAWRGVKKPRHGPIGNALDLDPKSHSIAGRTLPNHGAHKGRRLKRSKGKTPRNEIREAKGFKCRPSGDFKRVSGQYPQHRAPLHETLRYHNGPICNGSDRRCYRPKSGKLASPPVHAYREPAAAGPAYGCAGLVRRAASPVRCYPLPLANREARRWGPTTRPSGIEGAEFSTDVWQHATFATR